LRTIQRFCEINSREQPVAKWSAKTKQNQEQIGRTVPLATAAKSKTKPKVRMARFMLKVLLLIKEFVDYRDSIRSLYFLCLQM